MQKAAARSRVFEPIKEAFRSLYRDTIEKQYRGSLLFTMINLTSVKFMTPQGNVGGQYET